MNALPPPPGDPRISRPGARRFPVSTLVAIGAGVLVGVLVISIVAVNIATPGPQTPCPPKTCPLPPAQPLPPFVEGTPWSSSLGFSLLYDGNMWSAVSPDGSHVELSTGAVDLKLWIGGASAAQASPVNLIDQRLAQLKKTIPTLAPDCVDITGTAYAEQCPNSTHSVFGPALGFVPGIGGMWSGTTEDGTAQVHVVILAATDGNLSLVASAITGEHFSVWDGRWPPTMREGDRILNSISWTASQ